jgi:murein DD-endopeptidase MepM/ murein hydrolase activator NlpD
MTERTELNKSSSATYGVQGVKAASNSPKIDCHPEKIKVLMGTQNPWPNRGKIDDDDEVPFRIRAKIKITMDYGQRTKATSGLASGGSVVGLPHTGIDMTFSSEPLEGPQGMPIYATQGGILIHRGYAEKAAPNEGFGFFAVVETPLGKDDLGRNISQYSIYGHMKALPLSENDLIFQENQFYEKSKRYNPFNPQVDLDSLFEAMMRTFSKTQHSDKPQDISKLSNSTSRAEKLEILNTRFFDKTSDAIESHVDALLQKFQNEYGTDNPRPEYVGQFSKLKISKILPTHVIDQFFVPSVIPAKPGDPIILELRRDIEQILAVPSKVLTYEEKGILQSLVTQSKLIKSLTALRKVMQEKPSSTTLCRARREAIELLFPKLCPPHIGQLQPGQLIPANQLLGYMGATGQAEGPHLHWEVWNLESGLSFKELFLKIEAIRNKQISTPEQTIYIDRAMYTGADDGCEK